MICARTNSSLLVDNSSNFYSPRQMTQDIFRPVKGCHNAHSKFGLVLFKLCLSYLRLFARRIFWHLWNPNSPPVSQLFDVLQPSYFTWAYLDTIRRFWSQNSHYWRSPFIECVTVVTTRHLCHWMPCRNLNYLLGIIWWHQTRVDASYHIRLGSWPIFRIPPVVPWPSMSFALTVRHFDLQTFFTCKTDRFSDQWTCIWLSVLQNSWFTGTVWPTQGGVNNFDEIPTSQPLSEFWALPLPLS
jgi:hypothetical protein